MFHFLAIIFNAQSKAGIATMVRVESSDFPLPYCTENFYLF